MHRASGGLAVRRLPQAPRQAHMNVFGGEDRFWLGPEGGQMRCYFKQGDAFDLNHWQVPEPIDWGGWDIASQSASAARFHKRMTLRQLLRERSWRSTSTVRSSAIAR